MNITVCTAGEDHLSYADEIVNTIYQAALQRGTGIARRTPEYIVEKILQGKAVIGLAADGSFAGFCYIETWEHGRYVASSGLIVTPHFRKQNIARMIKKAALDLCRERYPTARIFGITTSAAVMKINTELGYRPVHFADLTSDDEFWRGCFSCQNHDVLMRTNRTMCLCTAMLLDPSVESGAVLKEQSANDVSSVPFTQATTQ